MSGAAETVDLNELGDIGAEQAALAQREAAATQQVEQAASQLKGEQQTKPSEDLTPAAKQAKEAEKAETENDTFSFDKFLEQKNKADAKPVAKEVAKANEATQTTTKVDGGNQQQIARDLTGIDAAHHEHFKRMSNESFNALKPIYLENAQLKQALAEKSKGGLPDSYYEHETAYVLTPEFASESAKVTDAEAIYNHYAQQANALANGSKTYTIVQRDAQGNLVTSAPIQADRNTALQIQRAEQQAYTQYLNAQAALNAIGTMHKQRATEARGQLVELENKGFPALAKPELKPVIADTITKLLPKAYHNNPLAPMLAKAVLTIMDQGQKLAAQQGQTQQTQQKVQTRQPTAAEIAGGGATQQQQGKSDEVTFDDFKRAKAGLL